MISANKKKSIVFIVGPTAIGKTALAIKLAMRINGQIISCDSMQVYKGMRILSQAPGPREMRKARHHLVGILSPEREYSAAVFRQSAVRLIDSIIERRLTPILVGGSGLYIKALIDGLFPSPKADLAFREKMKNFVLRYGNEKLYKRLSRIDPISAGHIHPNDTRRIIRSLEIYNSTGRTMTEMKTKTRGIGDEYDVKIFGFIRPRDRIYSNINSRVDRMFEEGVVKEVDRLRSRPLSVTARAVLGFKEIAGYLDGEYDLDTAKELTKRNTRRYAKRQLTWFRADKRIKWYDMDEQSGRAIISDIIKRMR